MHYNYFRDYDPKTGRYIEPDPIGVSGKGLEALTELSSLQSGDVIIDAILNTENVGSLFGGIQTNLYSYAFGSPTNRSDRTGLFGFSGPGFTNVRPDQCMSQNRNPYELCVDQANYDFKICMKLQLTAEIKGYAVCATVCVGAGRSYGKCLWECAKKVRAAFALGKAGCIAAYLARLEDCRKGYGPR